MSFQINGKVALVTGGAGGIGRCIVEALLENGIKGVVIADINEEQGTKVVSELSQKFNPTQILYQKTDVTVVESFEDAFKAAIQQFQHIDILFNNAGIVNENEWEKCVQVNLIGVINGMILATEKYLKDQKLGEEAVIVNTSSIASVTPELLIPTYNATKSAINAITRTYAESYYYNSTKIKVVAICPGVTETSIVNLAGVVRPGPDDSAERTLDGYPLQSPKFLADQVMKVVEKAPTGTIWIIEDTKPAYQYIYNDRKMSQYKV
ncbi:unnamed protein product [Phyllotreta striolata]|uniref:15-hydroxyprostaglandin dehydrogenase [NAD(+)] n=1 Tax=Phyllotreta striolata TaxID=444603 RepID=A0A9N9TMP1_PHYSR|nr:unnamed protein product [Phyllotreta striolata]